MNLIGLCLIILAASASAFGQGKCPDRTMPRNRPFEIIDKPKANYPKDFNASVQGTVTLRVEFLSTERIGKISVIKALPHGLTEQAIHAARQIKFKPEVKNCKAIDIFRPVLYSFSHY